MKQIINSLILSFGFFILGTATSQTKPLDLNISQVGSFHIG